MRNFSFSLLLQKACLGLLLMIFASGCATKAPSFGEKGYTEKGKASYYSNKLRGNKMANGQPYRPGKRTAAHKKLPFGTKVKVTNPNNGKSVKVRITDRGPFVPGRIIDVSMAAARKLEMEKAGVLPVQVKVIKPAKKK